jgi:uncharacterized membrane-anchored protein YhcB (DUF1043 family)
MKKAVFAMALGTALVGCGNADQERARQLQGEVEKLQEEIRSLRSELDAERNGPARLLARAKNEYSSSAYGRAKETLNQLVSQYPESGQAGDAKVILAEADAKIAAAEKARLAEEQRKAEEQRQLLARLDGSLSKKTDEIKGITWISHKSQPLLATYMSLYFGTANGKADQYPLRMKLNYYSGDWLFVQGVTIKADDKIFTLNGLDFQRDNGGGHIWEWSDTAVSDQAMLEKIINAKRVVIRFDGRQYYNDFVVPESQKEAMRDIVAAWKRYGGKA